MNVVGEILYSNISNLPEVGCKGLVDRGEEVALQRRLGPCARALVPSSLINTQLSLRPR